VSSFWWVAAIIGAFFAFGIVMGICLVMALPTVRRHRFVRCHPEGGHWLAPPPPPDVGRPPPWPGE
jgi:hypothetical protein